MELHIKNMVCGRCIKVVREELLAFGLYPESVELGLVKLQEEKLEASMQKDLGQALEKLGFELLDGQRSKMIEQIKNLIISRIFHSESIDMSVNWSQLISDQLFHDYNYLSSLFSSVEGITIEQYIIRQKIERVKELLFYDELSLSEIAFKLGYSSPAHLSAQFKKVTGDSPSHFKKSRSSSLGRKAIDQVI